MDCRYTDQVGRDINGFCVNPGILAVACCGRNYCLINGSCAILANTDDFCYDKFGACIALGVDDTAAGKESIT